jgi:PAS domain S-box-containing protein
VDSTHSDGAEDTDSRPLENASVARARLQTELREITGVLETRTRELTQQREWFEVTLTSIGDAVITTDPHCKVTFLNPVAEKLTGWPLAEARGRVLGEIFNIVNEDTRKPADNPVDKVLKTGAIVGLANHTALIARDGSEISIEDSAAPIRDLRGDFAGAVMVFHDVTRRRRAERDLRASEARMRAIFGHAAVGIALADAAGRFAESNPAFCSILGTSADELRNLSFGDLANAEEAPKARENLARLLRGDADHYALEHRHVRKNGAIIWCNTTVTVLKNEDGAPTQLVVIIEDVTERRLAAETRARLAAVVEFSDDAIITKTLEGIITSWNPGAQRVFGYTAHETIGKPVAMLIPENHADEEPAILERLRRGERIDHYETLRRRKDGGIITVSLSVSPLMDSDGRIIGASKIARDITRRRQAEEIARERAEVLTLLDETGKAINSNLELGQLLQTVTDIATRLSGARYGAFFYNVTNDGEGQYQLYALSGAPRSAFEKFGLPRNTPIFDPTFTNQGVVRSRDITQDSRYGQMGPHFGMPEGHLPVRSYLAVPVVSRSGEVIGGLFFGHPDPGIFTERTERLIIGVAAQAAIAVDNARLYEAAQREIERREQAEAELREGDRRKDEFLATLAHELRNPLAPIRQAALVSISPNATEAQKRWSHDVIARQVRNMSLLLEDLLDISRVTRGKLALRTERTDLASIVEVAVETARPLIEDRRHSLTIDLPKEPVDLVADPLRLSQIVSNLLTNAAKYTDPGGRIALAARSAPEQIEISVTDNGIGIPASALPNIFNMFSQLADTRDRAQGGLGIGLALAKGLAELHGGSLTAESDGPRRGSRFTVTIPRRAIESPRPHAEIQAPTPLPGTGGRTVVIADDNRDAAESLAMIVGIAGHGVTVVHDGAAAVDAIKRLKPDVAILDIGMPRLDGYEVAQRIRSDENASGVRLVALTGWGHEQDRARAMAAGFDVHLTKPVEPRDILELLG